MKQHWNNVHMSCRDATTMMWPLKCWMACDGRPGRPGSFSGVWEGGEGSHGPLVEMENYFSSFLSCPSKRGEISTKLKDFSHQSFISRLLFGGIWIFVLTLSVERFAAMHILVAQLHIKKLIRRENKWTCFVYSPFSLNCPNCPDILSNISGRRTNESLRHSFHNAFLLYYKAESLWEDITYVQELLQHEMTNWQQHGAGSQEPATCIMQL